MSSSSTHSTKRANSIQEVAEMFSLSKSFIRKEIRLGRMRAIRFGRRVLITESDLAAYIAALESDESLRSNLK